MEKTFYVKSIKISGYKKKLANHTEQTYPQLSMDKKFDFQLIVTVTELLIQLGMLFEWS